MVRRPGRAGGAAAAGPHRQRGAAGEQRVAKLGFGAASPARPLRLEVPQPTGVKCLRVFRGALEAAAPRRGGRGGRQGRGAVEGPSLLLGAARGVEVHPGGASGKWRPGRLYRLEQSRASYRGERENCLVSLMTKCGLSAPRGR